MKPETLKPETRNQRELKVQLLFLGSTFNIHRSTFSGRGRPLPTANGHENTRSTRMLPVINRLLGSIAKHVNQVEAVGDCADAGHEGTEAAGSSWRVDKEQAYLAVSSAGLYHEFGELSHSVNG